MPLGKERSASIAVVGLVVLIGVVAAGMVAVYSSPSIVNQNSGSTATTRAVGGPDAITVFAHRIPAP